MLKYAALFSLMLVLLAPNPALAAAGANHDEYSLELKGFSTELIQPTEAQVSRMEGRYPAPAPSRSKQAWYNFVNCSWGDSLQPFTYDTVDPPGYPKDKAKRD